MSSRYVENPLVKFIFLTLTSTLLLISDDWIQQVFSDLNQTRVEPEFVFVAAILTGGLWLQGSRWLAVGLLSVFAAMELIQLSNIAFSGNPINPSDVGRVLTEWDEIKQTGTSEISHLWHVLPSVLIPYGLLIALYWKGLSSRVALPRWRWAFILIVLILASKPYRATYRDMTAFLPGPTRMSLHNSINAFSFYFTRLAFREEKPAAAPVYEPYTITKKTSKAKHVWLIIADSVRADRFSVFGYQRNTTPNLLRWQKEQGLQARRGIAAAVSTGVSLPYMINVVREPGNFAMIESHTANLFRLAKSSGFKTFWLSSQESKLLHLLGKQYIDVSVSREDEPLAFMRKQDDALLDLLKQQEWGERNFVVINLRTAHLPYEDNYKHVQDQLEKWPVNASDERKVRNQNAYDNSNLYLDQIIGQLLQHFDRELGGERHLLFTADHGQLLGENNKWGHNELKPQVAEVPVLWLSRGKPGPLERADFQQDHWISHYEAGVWIATKLGHQIINANVRHGESFVQGRELYGDNFFMKVQEQDDKLLYSDPMLVSRWQVNRAPLQAGH
jgi:glucan phosphoethanolaminetransferase (alkaline phosphatase superfamily)